MRNLRLRDVTIAFLCCAAALMAAPALLAGVASAQSAGEEYDLELPTDPAPEESGDKDSVSEDAAPEPEPAPAPASAPAPAPTESVDTGAATGDGGEPSNAADGGGSETADESPSRPADFETRLASGATPAAPVDDDEFPVVPLLLAAAAVLAVPFGVWLVRRGRADAPGD